MNGSGKTQTSWEWLSQVGCKLRCYWLIIGPILMAFTPPVPDGSGAIDPSRRLSTSCSDREFTHTWGGSFRFACHEWQWSLFTESFFFFLKRIELLKQIQRTLGTSTSHNKLAPHYDTIPTRIDTIPIFQIFSILLIFLIRFDVALSPLWLCQNQLTSKESILYIIISWKKRVAQHLFYFSKTKYCYYKLLF